jgi:hypothetical protein
MARRQPTPEQQEFLDAVKRQKELRRRHIRRTQVINGRVYLGRWSYNAFALTILTAPFVVACGLLGWGVRLDGGNLRGGGLVLVGLILLAGFGQAAKRPWASPESPFRHIGVGLVVVFFAGINIFSRDAAEMLGILFGGVGAVTIIRGALALAAAALRFVFRRRPRPDELDPILDQNRPAA